LNDSAGNPEGLDFSQFIHFLFDVVDQWTESQYQLSQYPFFATESEKFISLTTENSYVSFIQNIFSHITTKINENSALETKNTNSIEEEGEGEDEEDEIVRRSNQSSRRSARGNLLNDSEGRLVEVEEAKPFADLFIDRVFTWRAISDIQPLERVYIKKSPTQLDLTNDDIDSEGDEEGDLFQQDEIENDDQNNVEDTQQEQEQAKESDEQETAGLYQHKKQRGKSNLLKKKHKKKSQK
jgi:hypothetical protein